MKRWQDTQRMAEHRKAAVDAAAYGDGFVRINPDGSATYIPAQQFYAFVPPSRGKTTLLKHLIESGKVYLP